MLPEMNTLQGYMLYSFIVYCFILFISWLAEPVVEKTREERDKFLYESRQGRAMR
jgi:hypothetical protein